MDQQPAGTESVCVSVCALGVTLQLHVRPEQLTRDNLITGLII